MLTLREPAVRLSCAQTQPGGRELLMMAAALAPRCESGAQAGGSAAEVYRQAMLGQLTAVQLLTRGR